jgi:hypothetical protein
MPLVAGEAQPQDKLKAPPDTFPFEIFKFQWTNEAQLPASGLRWTPVVNLIIFSNGHWEANAAGVGSISPGTGKFWFNINYFDDKMTLLLPTYYVLKTGADLTAPASNSGNDHFVAHYLGVIEHARATPMSDYG